MNKLQKKNHVNSPFMYLPWIVSIMCTIYGKTFCYARSRKEAIQIQQYHNEKQIEPSVHRRKGKLFLKKMYKKMCNI